MWISVRACHFCVQYASDGQWSGCGRSAGMPSEDNFSLTWNNITPITLWWNVSGGVTEIWLDLIKQLITNVYGFNFLCAKGGHSSRALTHDTHIIRLKALTSITLKTRWSSISWALDRKGTEKTETGRRTGLIVLLLGRHFGNINYTLSFLCLLPPWKDKTIN